MAKHWFSISFRTTDQSQEILKNIQPEPSPAVRRDANPRDGAPRLVALDEKRVQWPDLYLVAPARRTNVEVRQLDDDAVRQLNTERLPLTSDFDGLAGAVECALTAKTKDKYSAVETSRAWLALYFPFPSTPIIRVEIQRSVKQLATSSRDCFWQVWLVDAAGYAERMAIHR